MGYWRDNDRRDGYRDNRRYDRNNGYNNRGGYDRYDDRGYDNRGFNDRPQYDNQQPVQTFKYNVGDRLKLVAMPDTQVSVLRCGREQYECRCYPTLQTGWFYEHELAPLDE